MDMTNEEIVIAYRDSKNKKEQINILAERNLCDPAKIIDVLVESGYDRRSFNAFGKAMGRSKKSEKFETKVQEMIEESKQKKESADPETPATNKYAELQAECEKLKAKVKDYESYIGLLKERVLFLEENNTLMKEAIVQMCIKQYKEI